MSTNFARILLIAAALLLSVAMARATSYVYKPLKLPRAEDVVAFANGIEDSNPRVPVTRERILLFLAKGTNNTHVETWSKLEDGSSVEGPTMDGVFTDKAGKVYFWTIRHRRVLKIITAEHEQALIQLDR